MAQYRVNVTQVCVYSKDLLVEASSEEEARQRARMELLEVDEPDLPDTSNGWEQCNAWVGDDWEFEVMEPDVEMSEQA
jgi:hypothetical protein